MLSPGVGLDGPGPECFSKFVVQACAVNSFMQIPHRIYLQDDLSSRITRFCIV